jgi:hypothetical protein
MASKEDIFLELQEVLKGLAIRLKYDRGYFKGGFYRYKEQKTIYLNRAETVDQHISIIISEIIDMDLSDITLSPSLKEYIQLSPESLGG